MKSINPDTCCNQCKRYGTTPSKFPIWCSDNDCACHNDTNKQPETQSVLVEELVDELEPQIAKVLGYVEDDGEYKIARYSDSRGLYLERAEDLSDIEDMKKLINTALHTHSLATQEKNERLLLCLEDREKTIREQTQYIEAIRGAAGMGFNEFHEAIATKRGITLSDSNLK